MSLVLDSSRPIACSQSRRLTHRSTNMSSSSRNGILGSLRNKFGRKNSNPISSSAPFKAPMEHQSNHYGTNAPATRRPDRPGMNAFTTPSNEPPPMYTPAAPDPSMILPAAGTAAATSAATPTADDRYSFLSTFDTVFLIDDSGSMAGRSWRETAGALETITPICTAHDADGIDLYFLNAPDRAFYKGIRDVATVREIFQTVRPQWATPTGQRLNRILKPYLAECQARGADAVKPLNVIVITDGEPSDDVESVLIAAARKLDRLDAPAWQVGVQFFQVGNEPGAKEHLRQLDDELAELAGGEELRDLVDTVPFTGAGDEPLNGEGILKVVLGAVNRRLDRKRSKDLHRK